MTRRPIFGSRLYNQIVYPLLAASIVVGVVATLVAVYFLSDLTNKWVEQVAESSTVNRVMRVEEYARQMQRVALFAASSSRMSAAAATGDIDAMRSTVESETALGYDNVIVLDSEGKVLASQGAGVVRGDSPFGTGSEWRNDRPRVGMYELNGGTVLVAFQPLAGRNGPYSVGVVTKLDDDFVESLGTADDSAFSLYTMSGKRIATAYGNQLSRPAYEALWQRTHKSSPEIRYALEKASSGAGVTEISVDGTTYEVRAERVKLPGLAGAESRGYLVGIVSQGVSDEAGRTTTNLIMMWSIVAVVALVGLGGWVARRVSDPLVELAEGARRIADGDFETKVKVVGANEISELADTFNEMTDSLRERSESLTKKVLELATLYEMSRALGSTLDLEELLGSVLDSALRIFDLDLGYMALRDRETGTISIRAIRGRDEAPADGAVRSSMSEWVIREGRPLIFNPDSATASPQIDSVTGAKAALCVPLISPEGTIGSITIGSSSPRYRFNSDDVRLLSTIANHVTIAIGNIELFTSLQEAYLATVRSLAAAVDAKDSYTRGHSDRVAQFATLIAERMGLSHEQRIALEMAAYLHDIGKIGVSEDILLKPGRLEDDEMAEMRHHPLIGANILKPVAFPWAITPVVRHHHEAYDGSGYPAGLRGDEIPLLARILTVADSFEAMTADRPYRKGRPTVDAIEELNRCAGTQFDPRIVEVFSEVIDELEQSGELVAGDTAEEVLPEEARAVFLALVDGVFASFRRLGGPRLASNVEAEVDDFLAAEKMPFRISRGHVTFLDEVPGSADEELAKMRVALQRVNAVISRVSGATLVEHFYDDAFQSFSARMRHLARVLGFYEDPQ